MSEDIGIERRDGALAIRLNRPARRNAITVAMYAALADAIEQAQDDRSVRVITLSGEGEDFTAGNDLGDFLQEMPRDGSDLPVWRLLRALARNQVPLVAAVHGNAVGIGTTMLFHCDYVVASEWSTFSAPFADLGLTPEAGSSILAPRLMGHQRAFELFVLGEQFDAQRAYQAGFVNKIVAAEDVEAVAEEAAVAIANKPPEAVRTALKLLRGERLDLAQRIEKEAASFTELLRSPAALDALHAFIERRRSS